MTKICSECRFSVFEDHGYSNYTVEGTNFSCALRKHPDGTFDRFYGEDKRLQFAEQCNSFTEGENIRMDVERDDFDNLTPAQREVWDMHQKVPEGFHKDPPPIEWTGDDLWDVPLTKPQED